MEDALNNATLLYPWTDVEKMPYDSIMTLSLAQIEYLFTTLFDDERDDETYVYRVSILNNWNYKNIH